MTFSSSKLIDQILYVKDVVAALEKEPTPLRSYRREALVLLLGVFSYAWFILLEHTVDAPKLLLHSKLDYMIPFTPAFVIVYVAWYFTTYVPMIFMLFKNRIAFARYALMVFSATTIACFIYSVLPNGIPLRPATLGDDIFSRVISLLYGIDTPTNSAPSLHVTISFCTHIAITRYKNIKAYSPLWWLSLLYAALVSASTLFVKQHSVWDVLSGMLLAFLLYLFVYYPKNGRSLADRLLRID